MHSTDRQVLDAALHWASEGQRFALVTVARTWGSAPRPPGSWMALRADGQVQGSVSGGCLEDDLIARMRLGEFAAGTPRVLRYGVTQEEARRFGLPCGGTMELVVEPEPDLPALDDLARRIDRGECVQRRVTIGCPGSVVLRAGPGSAVQWGGTTLATVHGPGWRLLIVGAGQISTYLAPMALALGYQVLVCDPREEYADGWNLPGATMLRGMPDDVALELRLDPHTAVVALTHDPKLDDLVLLEALRSPAFYVGALGSAVNNQRRRERLVQHFDLTQEQVERLHGPVGLPIGSHTPPEIAVAVVAEITAARNGVDTRAWRRGQAAHSPSPAPQEAQPA